MVSAHTNDEVFNSQIWMTLKKQIHMSCVHNIEWLGSCYSTKIFSTVLYAYFYMPWLAKGRIVVPVYSPCMIIFPRRKSPYGQHCQVLSKNYGSTKGLTYRLLLSTGNLIRL